MSVPDGVLDALLKPENKSILQKVLLFHVSDVKILSEDIKKGANKVKTLEGGFFRVFNLPHYPLFIKDFNPLSPKAEIKKVDIKGSNGVVHIIDEVLLPKDLAL